LQDSALQGDRRVPSTLAVGDEGPMNPHEMHEKEVWSSRSLAPWALKKLVL
jgi:hypothetical protein